MYDTYIWDGPQKRFHLEFLLCYLLYKNCLNKSILFARETFNYSKSTIKISIDRVANFL